MSRLRDVMSDAARRERAALVVYITQGDPSPANTVAIVEAAAQAGADVIELGVPFSDPCADGMVIQEAMQRALAQGGGLSGALDAVAALRGRGCEVPVVLFGYANPLVVRGLDRFAAAARDAGVDAVLTVDMPVEELGELHAPLAAQGIDVVPLVAPTSGPERVARVRAFSPPFVYYISMTGVTGAAFREAGDVPARVAEIRASAGAPVAVGFGIKTPAHARVVGAYADGVVVGSAVVACIRDAAPGQAPAAVAGLVRALRGALDG